MLSCVCRGEPLFANVDIDTPVVSGFASAFVNPEIEQIIGFVDVCGIAASEKLRIRRHESPPPIEGVTTTVDGMML